MTKHTKRRKRRQAKQSLKHGRKAKPTHQGKSGRTGGMFHKKLKGLKDATRLQQKRLQKVQKAVQVLVE